MTKNSTNRLSPAEWKVMRIVWQQKSCAARDVYQVAGEKHGWAASTVKTILRRLVDKGYLKTTQVGNSFLYRPTGSPLKSLYGAADALLGNALEGTVGPLVAYMVRQGDLSTEEVDQLRSLLDQLSPEEENQP